MDLGPKLHEFRPKTALYITATVCINLRVPGSSWLGLRHKPWIRCSSRRLPALVTKQRVKIHFLSFFPRLSSVECKLGWLLYRVNERTMVSWLKQQGKSNQKYLSVKRREWISRGILKMLPRSHSVNTY